MRYLLLICTDEAAYQARSPEERAAEGVRFAAFSGEIEGRGVVQANARLRPSADATTVQVRDGRVLVSDGPFAESKELVGGFYLIDVADLDEAIEIAAKIPAAQRGTIEVRPVWELEA